MVKLVHIILIGILLGCLIISITPSIADKSLDGKPTKVFDAGKKEVVITDESTQLTIKQISIKQGVCEFEEIFEITASKDYTPSHNKDFKLDFDYRKQLPKNKVSSSEWFVYKNNKWIPLSYGKILKGNTYKYKLIVHKKAELGNNEIRVVPSFLDVKCEELSWWNVSWQYKINSTLDDVPSGGGIYTLIVHRGTGTNNATDVFLNDNCQIDYGDIRFVLDDEITEVNYWIADNTSSETKVRIEVPSSGKMYLYSGNEYVTTTSKEHDFYYFIDDFEDGNIDDWTCWIQGAGTHICDVQPGYNSNYSLRTRLIAAHSSGATESRRYNIVLQDNRIYTYSLWAKTDVWHDVDFNDVYIYLQINNTTTTETLWYTKNNDVPWFWSEYNITEFKNSTITLKTRVTTWDYDGGDIWADNIIIKEYGTESWQPWSSAETEVVPKTSLTQYNSQRKLARTSEGYLHRVYTKFDSDDYEIYYGLSTDGGNIWTDEKLTDSTTNCTNPTIATDSNNSIWIIYKNESTQIWSLHKEGLLDWNNTKVRNTDTNTVSCAIDSNDNLHLVSEQGSDISYTYYNGISWSASTYLSTSGINQYPSISIDGNDYLHVVWEENNNIRYKSKTGAGWQSIYNVTENETYNQTYPCIAVDTNNNIHVTWQTEDYQIKYRQNSGTWQATQTVCDGGVYEQRNPTIVISDGTYIIWYGQTATYNTNYIIRYKKIGGGIVDILHPSGKDAVYPNTIHAFHPKFCGADNCYANIPETGFAIVYEEKGTGSEIKYYSNSLGWRCPSDHYTVVIQVKKEGTQNNIYNFTAEISPLSPITTNNGEARFRCLVWGFHGYSISSPGYIGIHSPPDMSVDKHEIKTYYLTPEGGTQHNVTVIAKNSKTGATINSFTASMDTGQEGTTETGSITFYNISEGSRTVSVSSTGYYLTSDWFSLTDDTTRIVSLMSIEEDDGGTIAYKHLVEFQVVDYWTNPISDVFVEAKGIETTMGSWDWLWSIFGIGNETINESLVMNGTTDDLGGISFEMFETIKYQITFTNAEKGVNETLTIYPKDEKYVVVVGTATSTKHIDDHVSWNLTAEQVNSTHFKLSLSYIDYLIETSTLKFFVLNSSENEIYNKTFTYAPWMIFPSEANYMVEKEGGEEYIWGFVAEHETFGEIKDTKVITFKQFIDLGLKDEKYYTWISIALLIFFTGMFSVTLSKFGYFLVPGMGMLFWYIGWLGTNITLLTIAMGLGVLAYLGTREKEKGL